MWSITDWFLEKMNLIEDGESETVEEESEEDIIPWLETIGRNKVKEQLNNKHIFYKIIGTYDDAREVIREYKLDAECIISFNQIENSDAQGMMNYICGGVFALGGSVHEVGGNVFIVSHVEKKETSGPRARSIKFYLFSLLIFTDILFL